jgi:hypothetical protein
VTDCLRVVAPESLRGETCRLDRNDLLIGRAATADWCLPDPGVSRRHAVIRLLRTHLGKGAWEIEDLGSTGGTWVNGHAVTSPRRLHPGDRVRLATVETVYGPAPRQLTIVGAVKGAAAVVVSLGAIAGAILSIGSLWPDDPPPTTTIAKFNAVEAIPGVPLSEYQKRRSSSAVHLASARRPAARASLLRGAGLTAVHWRSAPHAALPAAEPDPSAKEPSTDQPTDGPTDQPTGGPTDLPTSQPASASPASPTPSTTRLQGASGIFLSSISGVDDEKLTRAWDDTQKKIWSAYMIKFHDEGPDGDGVSVPPDLQGLMRSPEGKLLPSGKAAARIIRVLEDARPKGAREPLGVVVHAEVELTGFKNQEVMLSWSMWTANGGTRLHAAWLNDTLAYRLVAGADHDATAVDIWVPIPKAHGPYYVRTTMSVKGGVVAEGKTGTFR